MKIKNLKFKIILSFLAFLATGYQLLATPKAYADFSVGIYPPIIQIDTNTPASIKTPIEIQNFSSDPVTLSIAFKPFKPSIKNNGEVQFLQNNEQFQGEDPHIFDKMQVIDGDHVVSDITLAPQQQKILTLHIGIPKDEPPSDYYFSIVFASEGQLPDQNTASTINAAIATNVLLSIGPTGPTNGFIKNFFTDHLFYTHGPVNFSLLLQNTSSHFIVPKGNIVIKNMFGQNIAKLSLLPVNVLAGSERLIPDKDSRSLQYAIFPEKILVGPYSAHVTIALSSQGPIFERTIYFFAMPISGIIILAILAVAGTIFTIKIRERMQGN